MCAIIQIIREAKYLVKDQGGSKDLQESENRIHHN